MTPEQLFIGDMITYVTFGCSMIILFLCAGHLRRTKQQFKRAESIVSDTLKHGNTAIKKLHKIRAYESLKHCGFNIDDCTATIKFENGKDLQAFISTHKSIEPLINSGEGTDY